MIRAVIVEDEQKSRETLRAMLDRYCKDVVVLGEADGVQAGIELIQNIQPELVFLDIQMPDGSGFGLLEQIGDINFEVVFTTAYDHYAIKAIKFSALDYLLKPIVTEELVNAIKKVRLNKDQTGKAINYKTLKENVSDGTTGKLKKIILSTANQIHIIEIADIIRCESENYYTKYYFTKGSPLLISKTLKETETLLKEHGFIRPHKSHLVNIEFIDGFMKNDGGFLKLKDGSLIPVSRRKKETIVEILNTEI
ncbi:MAG: response regulator transcription factor [Bacteroidales bacterium]|nr:response regulator transcription factor [Bacteroidales bacterium]